MAGGGLAGDAGFLGITLQESAGPLDDFADAAVDRCGDAPGSVCLGAGAAGRDRVAEGQEDRDGRDDAGSERGAAIDRAARQRRELRGVSEETGAAGGMATPTREDLARLDRKRKKKGSNQDWVNPHDPDARITKMKDGSTHLAHKAEHAVDMDTGAVVAVTLQGADLGDTASVKETLAEAGVAVAELIEREAATRPAEKPQVNLGGVEEVVADKGYHRVRC